MRGSGPSCIGAKLRRTTRDAVVLIGCAGLLAGTLELHTGLHAHEPGDLADLPRVVSHPTAPRHAEAPTLVRHRPCLGCLAPSRFHGLSPSVERFDPPDLLEIGHEVVAPASLRLASPAFAPTRAPPSA